MLSLQVQQGFDHLADGASVLAMSNYVPHMAGRLTIRQIDRDYGPIDQYEWIVLPADEVPIDIGGKLFPQVAAGWDRASNM